MELYPQLDITIPIKNSINHLMEWVMMVISCLLSYIIVIIGMYPNEEDVYGDELDGDEDKNDGLNALVYS